MFHLSLHRPLEPFLEWDDNSADTKGMAHYLDAGRDKLQLLAAFFAHAVEGMTTTGTSFFFLGQVVNPLLPGKASR